MIFLYVAKLFHLYVKVYVNGYQNEIKNPDTKTKYMQIIDNLESLSKDLWFFDNEPTQYDIQNSDYIKLMRKNIRKADSDDIVYYKNPLERMKGILSQNLSS